MKITFWIIVAMIAALWIPHKMDAAYAKGVMDGRRTALNTNPVSEQLEITCAGLWVGEQAKKQTSKM